jgi:hypothetical protein
VPGASPVKEIGELDPVAVTVSVPLETTYEEILTPPVFVGAVKETVAVVGDVVDIESAVTESGTVDVIVSVSD